MSILVDDRENGGIVDQLSRYGVPVTVVHLDFADTVIEAKDGRLIGYERKRITDLIASMVDRRLAGHQLRGMWGLYDRVELVIEGWWRAGEHGAIEIPTGPGKPWQTLYHRGSGISYRQVDSYLQTQRECGGVAIWRTCSSQETAQLYVSRWHWWQKDYELHKAHDTLYTTLPEQQHRGAVTLHNGEPNLVTRMAAQLPGIDAIAWDVGKHFEHPSDMVLATEAEWRRVPWFDRKGNEKHFGKERARELVKALKGGTL